MTRFWITIISLAVLAAVVAFSPYAVTQSPGVSGLTDTLAPVTNATLSGSYAQGVYTSDVILTLSASDSTSGVNYTEYSINNGTWISYSGPVTLSSSSNVSYRSVDYAGNIEANNTISFYRIHISLGPGYCLDAPAVNASVGQTGINPSITPETLLTVTGSTAAPRQSESPFVWLLILTFAVLGIVSEFYFLTMKK